MNILDTIKGIGLSTGISLIGLIYPPIKPLIEQIQKAIEDGKITEENFEETAKELITFLETFTPDQVDAFLEQLKVVMHEAIKAGQLAVIAFGGKTYPGPVDPKLIQK